MPESKPAVSESRAAFEKWWRSTSRLEQFEREEQLPEIYKSPFAQAAWEGWQSAERDTRERCAREWIAVLKKTGITVPEVLIKSAGGVQFPARKGEV